MVDATALVPHGDALHRRHRSDGLAIVWMAHRFDCRAYLRLSAPGYPLGTECLLPDAVSVHGNANVLALLRSDPGVALPSQASHRRFDCLLSHLSFLGGNGICAAIPFCRPRFSAMEGLEVVGRLPPLSLSFFHRRSRGGTVLLPDASRCSLSDGRVRSLESHWTIPVLSR